MMKRFRLVMRDDRDILDSAGIPHGPRFTMLKPRRTLATFWSVNVFAILIVYEVLKARQGSVGSLNWNRKRRALRMVGR